MPLADFVEPEVAIAAAVTAGVASPSVRRSLRRSAVYGLAGILVAYDKASEFAQTAAKGIRDGANRAAEHFTSRGQTNGTHDAPSPTPHSDSSSGTH